MSIGKLRNRYCPSCDSGKRYKDCCWDKDYWAEFSKSIIEKDGQEIVRYDKKNIGYN